MTSLVDVVAEPGNLEQTQKDLQQAVALRAAGTVEQSEEIVETADEDAVLPEKLRGKTRQQIAEMYQNLESAHGRQANETGVLRSLTDRLLELKRDGDLEQNGGQRQATPKPKVSAAELLEQPTEAIERFTNATETRIVSKLDERLNRIESGLVQNQFAAKHSDAQQITHSTEFVSWVKQSPTRQRAAQQAAQGNFGAADDLLTEFKSSRKAAKPTKKDDEEVSREGNLQAARSASLESGSSGQDKGGQKSGKMFSRAGLMRMRIERPEEYYEESNQAEILAAYAENRVK